ncbi:phytanoyl-CoA dioxygenase [Aureococcus anophagefferens]|nr:phytanoyl-CoA dioxygenase [Aureococcus anophagefferens]
MRGVRPWLAFAITAALLGAAASWRNGTISRNTTTTKTTAKLVLLSAPRSGSTLLVEMLRTHDDVLMHGEPFHASDLRASAKDGFAGNRQRAVASLADDRPALLELWYEADLCAPERRRGALAKVERFLGVPGGGSATAPHLP